MGAEFSSMAPVANDRAYEVVKAIWSPDGKMSAEGGKKVFDYLQPPGTKPIDYSKTFANDFLPK